MSDAQLEANWRDYWLEHDGLLELDQPTESATIEHRRKMEAPFTALERRLLRSLFVAGSSQP